MVEIVFPVGSYRTTGTKSNMSECVLSFQLKSLQLWPNDLSSTVCFICCCCWCFFLFFTAVHNLCVWDTSQQEAVSPLLWDCFVEPQELPQSPSGSRASRASAAGHQWTRERAGMWVEVHGAMERNANSVQSVCVPRAATALCHVGIVPSY